MVGQVIADRYELKDVVGTGGMSSVFCAYDTLLERNVALKLLHEHHSRDEAYVERFRREARSVAQLSHPGIVIVIDRGEEDGRQYIVFEYIEGENLKQLVERSGPLPVRRVLELGAEIARALAFAHAQGLVHRDVKPQNVLLSEDGPVKVTDFGIARSVDGIGTTETGTVLGTSHYVAPEQARGERVDAKTDVYAFGVVLFELLTGEVPFDGESFVAVALKHVNEPAPSVLERRPDCPLRLAGLVERCLAKSPLERPAMDEVGRELETCLAELDARPDGEPTMISRAPRAVRVAGPRRERARRRSWPLLAVLAALVGAGVVAAVLAFGDGGGGGTAGAGSAVAVRAVASYDPDGDGAEHDDRLSLATDGKPSTYWTTEGYGDFAATKDGVGLVLEAPQPLRSITVTTDLPGWTAEIEASDSRTSFSQVVGESKTVAASTTWELEDTSARYYLVWITSTVDDGSGKQRAHVNEVTARG
jgi:eukaryotic-like serine/threonine-protein kinase